MFSTRKMRIHVPIQSCTGNQLLLHLLGKHMVLVVPVLICLNGDLLNLRFLSMISYSLFWSTIVIEGIVLCVFVSSLCRIVLRLMFLSSLNYLILLDITIHRSFFASPRKRYCRIFAFCSRDSL